MIKIPFDAATFGTDMKPKLSGSNQTLNYENIESTITRICVEIGDLLGEDVFNKIVDKTSYEPESEADTLQDDALDYLQRSILHLTLYHHGIYLIARIGNDGITVAKGDNETTIFKYQQEELNNKLITDGWFWINRLLKLLDANLEKFTTWAESPAKTELDKLPVTLPIFKRWVGVSSEYFMLSARWIINEVWTDCILSRFKAPVITDELMRAVCYEVMARCCQRMPIYELPETIRKDISTEMQSTKSDETYIRERISTIYQQKASAYWQNLDYKIEEDGRSGDNANISSQPYVPSGYTEHDNFAIS